MEFYIDKEPLQEALAKLLKVSVQIPSISALHQINITSNAGATAATINLAPDAALNAIMRNATVAKHYSWLQKSPSAEFRACLLTFQTSANQQLTVALNREVLYDKLQLTGPALTDISIAIAATDLFRSHYSPVPEEKRQASDAGIIQAVPRELLTEVIRRLTDSAIDLRAATKDGLTRFLESVSATEKVISDRLIAAHAALRAEVDAERKKQSDDFAAERAKLHAEIDSERRQLREQDDAARQALGAEREAFDVERKKFNDRRSTLVRRQVFDELKQQLLEHKKVELSRETNAKTVPVRNVCIIVGLFALLVWSFGAYLLFRTGQLSWLSAIPFSSGILIFVFNSLYYVRFANAWLTRHADLETRNQLLQLDMARASWFAEMLLEYRDEKQTTIPDSVIQVMTKNLFELQAGSTPVRHPVDDVAAFLERVNRIRLGQGEVEMGTGESSSKARK